MGKAHKLTPLQVKNLKEPGTYGDGAGLLLRVTDTGARHWIYRFMKHGKDTWLGLGAYPEVTLAEAREAASELRKQIRAGQDPLTERRSAAEAARAENAKGKSFDWCAKEYIAAMSPSWKNTKHTDQWKNTIANYASPKIGQMDVAKITTEHIMAILEPIWTTKAETASRVRGRIENILDWATVMKFRTGDNPARLRGHLDVLLPTISKKARVKHHPALPYTQAADFMTDLRSRNGSAARAVEFAILTAARSGEVRGATWNELDFEAGLWVIPKERMKMKKEHRVPLTEDALRVLETMKPFKRGDLIFGGVALDDDGNAKPLSDMSLSAVIKRMHQEQTKKSLPGWIDRNGEVITVHGFRSTFRDWVAEATEYPNEMAEMALAHAVSNAVEAAYRRGDMIEKRRGMMQTWANHCKK